jgi:steroid 5-alpha reductase family enzyme
MVITFLLRFVSGVPMSEERYKGDKEFEEYKKKTPPMAPCFLFKR